ncbi:Proable exocyst complex component Sec6 [Aphelenchoides bicaudatus]|nr:Proable exocyst complex component Sec6 [Aphelenchoides bicaudatus]
MNSSSIEQKAEAQALEFVANLFQRPDQLEKLDFMRKKADGKKAAVEAMLRTGVQSQLEGIRTAINHLHTARDDLLHIDKGMNHIRNSLKIIPALKSKMSKLSEANMVHGQYAAAVDNLKHIFHINETIEKTHELITEGKLLHAHKNIMELEAARDDLMAEVYKVKSDRKEYDLNLLRNYFGDVDRLVRDLGKQLWIICSRALQAVQDDSGSKQLVSALRVIEREHRIDVHYEKQKGLNPNLFKPPGRPREWKKQLFVVMKNVVQQRVEGSQFEDRTTNKQWLARYLEVCRKIIVEDLKIVKSGLVTLFPPEYRIYDRMIKFYHDCITERIKEIAATQLEKNEIVQLLDWIKNYGGESVLGTPKLGIQTGPFLHDNPLLPRSTMDQLLDKFVELTQRDLSLWMDKALVHEKDDWYRHIAPEEDNTRYYYTQLPSILFGMIEDQVKLTKMISHAIVPRFIDIVADEFLAMSSKLKDAATAYRNKHFEDRAFFQRYTATMIALANNMDVCVESTDKLEKHIRLTMEIAVGDDSNPVSPKISTIESPLTDRSLAGSFQVNRQDLIAKINQLKQKWRLVMQVAVTALLDEIYEDINKHLDQLLTKNWMMGTSDLDTICVTIRDYYMDYERLRPHIRFLVLNEIYYKVVGEYVIAMDSQRLTYANYKERHLSATRIREDTQKIEKLFDSLSSDTDFPFPRIASVLPSLAEIIDLQDKSLLSLEVSSFARKYSDVHSELLSSLMSAREDVKKNEAKSIADEALNHVRLHPKDDKEMLKLFQMCKADGRRNVQIIEDLRTVFNTFIVSKN